MTYLTYDDIQLVPAFSDIKSRQSIDLTTNLSKNYTISIPIVGSPMDTVCESEMAFKLYQLGGVGCIHRFNKIIEQYTEIQKLCEKISATGKWSVTIPIMAAIGVQEDDKKRAKNLIKAGANVLLIDVAHGDHQNVIDMTKWCKDNLPSHVDIIAGNIATAEAAERLQDAGADGLRVGIGGGSLMVPFMRTFGYDIRKSIGTAAAIGFLIAISGTITMITGGKIINNINTPYSVGYINLLGFIVFVPVTMIMARLGAKAVYRINKKILSKIFGSFLIIVSIRSFIEYLNIT